jgi:hypothetical protein
MDVAYLDLPYVAHVSRRAFLAVMSVDCWEDGCRRCEGCSCACHDDPPPRLAAAAPAPRPRRCRTCGYLIRSESHKVACATVMERISRLADSIGVPR